ncbi:MAG: 4Fe-4S binding protein [Spirochaetes bacterium]|nr:4Fe-4S binding protein [Spirochaetota bacterium]
MKSKKNIYKQLREHMDRLPVGFPSTITGVEIRILKKLFTPDEALTALALTGLSEPIQKIADRSAAPELSGPEMEERLEGMEKKGTVFSRILDGQRLYSLVPYVVGMYEFQAKNLTGELYRDTASYFKQGYAVEYLTTSIPQMRVVPIEKSLTPGHSVATYDEVKKLVYEAGERISVAACICKKAMDLSGELCAATDLRDVCIALRDYSDLFVRQGWARPVSREEAFGIIADAENDGLVIQTSNERQPQFICACCGCCCGILGMMKFFPRPADFAASNYSAVLDAESCIGCGICVKRCTMDAIGIKNKKAALNSARCIGCGLCVSTCKPGALKLERKTVETVPPLNTDELYGIIAENKRSRPARFFTILKSLLGMRAR